jgi:hypothetical protein
MYMLVCHIEGEPERPGPSAPCNWKAITGPEHGSGGKTLWADDKLVYRLEDSLKFAGKPITRLSVIVYLVYEPLFIPWERRSYFGFMSAKGEDGKLYWRQYAAHPP